MKKLTTVIAMFVVGLVSMSAGPAWTRPNVYPRHAAFEVPKKLRPRVDFWKDIFTKYGKFEIVVHHRNFPQAVFDVLDFRAEGERMGPIAYEKFRKGRVKVRVAAVREAVESLSKGNEPRTILERRVESAMRFMPGGLKKYKEVLKDDLIRTQTGIKEKYADALRRSGRYMHIIEDIFVREFGLPVELTRLPFIESSFDYKAYSSVGAAGIWQFMPRTAKLYMTVNGQVDERRDVIEATKGAAKYLEYAYKQIGNWPLALTSYNHGIAGVKRKTQAAGLADIAEIVEHPTKRVFGFASTNFYPEFLAALEIYDDYHRYFPGLKREPALALAEYTLPHSFSIGHIMKKLDISKEELEPLNYAISKSVWTGRYRLPKGYALKVPQHYAARLGALKAPQPSGNSPSAVYGGRDYRVRSGDTLLRIAKKFGTTVSKIRKLNGMASDRIYVGQRLIVKASGAAAKKPSAGSSVVGGTYVVHSGDSLFEIARKFNMTLDELKAANGLRSNMIRAGQKLRVASGSGASSGAASAPKSSQKRSASISYTVKRGDSLWSISRKFGVSISALKQANGKNSNSLRAGRKLVIPK